ncbi:MAG: recombinase family protein [Acidimicrobiia bacterium]|nr:recombinase family protein [Acidimicrobiia bacterium]MBT8217649.1 recombinase family protein [Acidimicrobiia bacterium]NNF11235.1 recombinase family protein [Acidimicrobiia bacterium]NNL68971.1 recombinase family protein [Acidimicrobiia bacterium]
MRVVGYVRELFGPEDADPAFVQGEAIRGWVRRTGHNLISVCQDVRQEGHGLARDGFQALLGIVALDGADGVVVPSLRSLSPDLMTQEIMIWDLRRRGVAVMSIDERDHELLLTPTKERLLMRDVLARLEEYYQWARPAEADEADDEDRGDGEVVVELIPASDA